MLPDVDGYAIDALDRRLLCSTRDLWLSFTATVIERIHCGLKGMKTEYLRLYN